MLIYLDQNKWIELARVVHGKDTSARGKRILRSLEAATESGSTIPLSAIHYMETARISNTERRRRLGQTMWRFSRGTTMAAYMAVVKHELEHALSKHFSQVTTNPFSLLGYGSTHAFTLPSFQGPLASIEQDVEEALLVGSEHLKIDPPFFKSSEAQERFRNHLASLHARSKELPKGKVENWLYALLLADINKPLAEIFIRHNIPKSEFENLGEAQFKSIIDDMPTRRLDLHLHRQIVRNPAYASKITDLEDWTGVGVASCYFDVVVCENHMADMLKRNGYRTKARVETNLDNAFVLFQDA